MALPLSGAQRFAPEFTSWNPQATLTATKSKLWQRLRYSSTKPVKQWFCFQQFSESSRNENNFSGVQIMSNLKKYLLAVISLAVLIGSLAFTRTSANQSPTIAACEQRCAT